MGSDVSNSANNDGSNCAGVDASCRTSDDVSNRARGDGYPDVSSLPGEDVSSLQRLDDLFPGSGAVTRAWDIFTGADDG